MATQTVFRRYEIKYLITTAQKAIILDAIAPYMALDGYGRTTIRNLYLDTPDFRLIRHSIEKPVYKEKLRLRSYTLADEDSMIFVELKKKYQSVVYKRRLVLPEGEVMSAFDAGTPLPVQSQIGDEIAYVRQFYGDLRPRVYLAYAREAYYMRDGTDFRITFDDEICYRRDGLSLTLPPGGTALLEDGLCLMELKTPGAIPLWLTGLLSREGIFKTSFSKYGRAYADILTEQGVHIHA